MTDANPFEELVGQVLEKRYRILKPLGEGGMGAVFLGEHVVIGRKVAIKVLHARLGQSQDFADRFAREAVAAGRLAHPNCVPVTDSGQLEDGTAYLVMELVKGRGLGDVLDEDGPKLDPIRALRITRDVLRGLGHAHKMGIVHRDVKPDNVMLTEREDNPEFARVLDFGIAKLRDDDNKETAALTQAGMSVGTPTYLSPEQALGEEVDRRSDLYSTAVMLFEMLAGRPPFTAANPVGILTKHATAPVPHVWDLAPELADQHELDELVQHGLEKLRADRFQDAAEFVEAINATLVCLGANLTPLPTTANFATITPAPPSGMERAQTGPAQAQETWTTTNAALLAANYHTGSTLARPGKTSRFGARQGIIAMAIVALLAGAIWATTRSAGTPGNTSMSKNKDLLFGQYITALKEGKTCQDRLLAVKALAALNDERAIPELKRARRRMRGGTLGFGASNTNRCLRKAAQVAIKSLSK